MRITSLIWIAALAVPTHALRAQEAYRAPPEIVQKALDARRLPGISVAPGGARAALLERAPMPRISDVAQPMLRLAGIRFSPVTNARYLRTYFTSITFRDISSGREVRATLPDDAKLSFTDWSPGGDVYVAVNNTGERLELWVVDPETGTGSPVPGIRLNSVLGRPCDWIGHERLLCAVIPEPRGEPPERSTVPAGPIVQRSGGGAAPVRTYQDLLKSPFDEELFEYYGTAQLGIVDTKSLSFKPIGEPGLYLQHDPSPGGSAILVRRVIRPYSYLVPVTRFAYHIEIWDTTGTVAGTLFAKGVADRVPIGGVPVGPRSFRWRPDAFATLIYAEALDQGNPRRKVEYRDRLVSLAAPFSTPFELAQLNYRFAGINWGRKGLALVTEFDRPTRKMRTWAIDADHPHAPWKILIDRSIEDRYGDPGSPVLTTDANGKRVLFQSKDGKKIYLAGRGASPEGEFPFLDELKLKDGKTKRLWQSRGDRYESVVSLLDTEVKRIITRAESVNEPPNYFLRDVRRDTAWAITRVSNPVPELASLRREIIKYRRDDGVDLSGTLYYPTDYVEGKKVPVIFWIYPREFASARAAGQVTGSAKRFVLPRGASHLFLLTQGYAVLDNPTLPVVGGDSANNTYVEQTVAGARAAVDYLMDRGIADGRFGVGGHSYGAFATANLLAHSDLFKAGVARSGAYNRTLTPFGFQNERRTFWEARDVYIRMMPFTYADSINEPILLIHGMNDNNSGTFPIQSERMYHAIKGLGGTVEYVQLPFESHGYAARESIMDTVARMIEWFDRYVKGSPVTGETEDGDQQ